MTARRELASPLYFEHEVDPAGELDPEQRAKLPAERGVRRQARAVPTTTWPAIARGEQPPPPVPGDADLYRTPAAGKSVPKGVKPEDVGKHAISR